MDGQPKHNREKALMNDTYQVLWSMSVKRPGLDPGLDPIKSSAKCGPYTISPTRVLRLSQDPLSSLSSLKSSPSLYYLGVLNIEQPNKTHLPVGSSFRSGPSTSHVDSNPLGGLWTARKTPHSQGTY